MQTSVPGIFAAGNVVHVYDLVDWVTEAGFRAGRGAAKFALAAMDLSYPYPGHGTPCPYLSAAEGREGCGKS